MAKEIFKVTKINLIGASRAIDPKNAAKFSSCGVNMVNFFKEFYEATKDRPNDIVPTVITTYNDKTFKFVIKKNLVRQLLFKAANITKGSPNRKQVKVGKVTKKQIEEIAKYKLDELNCFSLESAISMVKATALNMGIEVEE